MRNSLLWLATVTLLATFPTPAQQGDWLNPHPALPAPVTIPLLRQHPGTPWKMPQALNLMQPANEICSIPLLEVPVSRNLERMPVVRPPAVDIDPLIQAKVPAPPCHQARAEVNPRPSGAKQ